MRIGTRLLPRPEADALDGAAPPRAPALVAAPQWPGADGTLLAVVPIPGTGTSLAIVGYPVSNETLPQRATRCRQRRAGSRRGPRPGCSSTTTSGECGRTGKRSR